MFVRRSLSFRGAIDTGSLRLILERKALFAVLWKFSGEEEW